MDTTLSTWDVLGIAAQFYVARIVQGTTFHMIFKLKSTVFYSMISKDVNCILMLIFALKS